MTENVVASAQQTPRVAPDTQRWLDSLVEAPPAPEVVAAQVRARLRKAWTAAIVVSLLVGLLIGRYGWRPDGLGQTALTPPPDWAVFSAPCAPGTPYPTITPQPLRVYVSGAVVASRVVTLSPGSLLADALHAAGGTMDDADLDSLNLAAPLHDHQHIVVPRRSAAVGAKTKSQDTTPPVVVNLNAATAAELETLPHIGPAMAQRILDYRTANGPFEQKEDLMHVSGIGEARYADIAPLVVVDK